MIRVNLVDAGRRAEKRGAGFDATRHLAGTAAAILLATALVVGWRYWSVTRTEADLDAQLASARQEEAQLKEILQQVQTFETRRTQLEQRVALIDELRQGQTVPVHIIDQVSRALPNGMWLTKLQQTGATITIEGECLSLTALSDFVGNLETSQYFARPVEIINSEVVAARENLPDVIRFSVKGTFQMAGIPRPTAAPPKAARPEGAQKGTASGLGDQRG